MERTLVILRHAKADRPAGVWAYRSGGADFVVPFVGATRSHYLPSLHQPGTWEVRNCGRRGTDFPALYEAFEQILPYEPDLVIYALVLLLLMFLHAGNKWGFGRWWSSLTPRFLH